MTLAETPEAVRRDLHTAYYASLTDAINKHGSLEAAMAAGDLPELDPHEQMQNLMLGLISRYVERQNARKKRSATIDAGVAATGLAAAVISLAAPPTIPVAGIVGLTAASLGVAKDAKQAAWASYKYFKGAVDPTREGIRLRRGELRRAYGQMIYDMAQDGHLPSVYLLHDMGLIKPKADGKGIDWASAAELLGDTSAKARRKTISTIAGAMKPT